MKKVIIAVVVSSVIAAGIAIFAYSNYLIGLDDYRSANVQGSLVGAARITEAEYWTIVSDNDADPIVFVAAPGSLCRSRKDNLEIGREKLINSSRDLTAYRKPLVRGMKIRFEVHPEAGFIIGSYLQGKRDYAPSRDELIMAKLVKG